MAQLQNLIHVQKNVELIKKFKTINVHFKILSVAISSTLLDVNFM